MDWFGLSARVFGCAALKLRNSCPKCNFAPGRRRARATGHFSLSLAVFSVAGLSLEAQSFRIDEIRLSGTNVVIQHPGSTNSYFVLYRGTNPSAIRQPADAALGRLPSGQFSVPLGAQSAFFRVSRVPQDAPLDTDGDGIDDLLF